MAQVFPMPLADFFDGLPIASFAPDLDEALQMNESGGGEIFTADLGSRLWRNDIVVRTGHYVEIERIRARISLLRFAGRSLFMPSMPIMAPQYDPDGSILGASVVTLTDVAANNREITLSGLPVGYKLQTGDPLSFTYGEDPVRYAMHQVVNTVVADGAGVITNLEVVSFIRPGFALDTAVTLIKPYYKAVLVPGSTKPTKYSSQFGDGIQFSVVQTFR